MKTHVKKLIPARKSKLLILPMKWIKSNNVKSIGITEVKGRLILKPVEDGKKLIKFGTSLGVILPKKWLKRQAEQLDMDLDEMEWEIEEKEDKLIVKPCLGEGGQKKK